MEKKLRFILGLLFLPLLIHAQFSDFEDGTLNGWANLDNSTVTLTNELYSIPNLGGTNYLLKTCDGTNSVSGQMSIKSSDFNGNLVINTNSSGTVGVDRCEFMIRNNNSFDLHLRIVFIGINNTKIVSTTPIIIASGSGWIETFFPVYSNSLFTLFPGTTPGISVEDVLGSVVETKIIHNTSVSTEGEIITGLLEIDEIGFRQLLAVQEVTGLKVKAYPNPFKNSIFLELGAASKGKLTITSIHGQKLIQHSFSSKQLKIDASSLKSKGIYFLKIETTLGTLTKKIVKE